MMLWHRCTLAAIVAIAQLIPSSCFLSAPDFSGKTLITRETSPLRMVVPIAETEKNGMRDGNFGSARIISTATSKHTHSQQYGLNNLRRNIVHQIFLTGATLVSAVAISPAKKADATSYSSNSRNMGRLASGDRSGGSTYDNDPKTASSRRRRAMTGCKIPSARAEAAQVVLKTKSQSLSEKDCNLQVMSGDSEFMLQAMKNLDCPECPYGVAEKR